jgi:hypothetical protein
LCRILNITAIRALSCAILRSVFALLATDRNLDRVNLLDPGQAGRFQSRPTTTIFGRTALVTYRLYGLDSDDRIKFADTVESDEVKSVWDAARKLLATYPAVEAWEGSAKAFRIEREPQLEKAPEETQHSGDASQGPHSSPSRS